MFTSKYSALAICSIALSLTISAFPTEAVASGGAPRTRRVAKKGNRLVRKARVVVRKLTRPLRPQPKNVRLDWMPKSQQDFNIVGLVKSFQAQVPRRVVKKMNRASAKKLAKAHSVSYTQKVDDGLGRGPRRAAVHITRGTVNVPLGTFLKRMPADKWGVKLDHYLGGKVKVVQRDKDGSPKTQVERMVLSGLPGNLNIRALNLDMSKVEKKEVVKDRAGNVKKVTMFWRVHDSANRTTIMDVGSVSFEAKGNNQTQVTFHSAHRLGKNGVQFPNLVVKPTLRSFFSDHVKHYRKLVTQ